MNAQTALRTVFEVPDTTGRQRKLSILPGYQSGLEQLQ